MDKNYLEKQVKVIVRASDGRDIYLVKDLVEMFDEIDPNREEMIGVVMNMSSKSIRGYSYSSKEVANKITQNEAFVDTVRTLISRGLKIKGIKVKESKYSSREVDLFYYLAHNNPVDVFLEILKASEPIAVEQKRIIDELGNTKADSAALRYMNYSINLFDASCKESNPSIESLIEIGYSPNEKVGDKPWFFLSRTKEQLEFFVKKGANLNELTSSGKTIEEVVMDSSFENKKVRTEILQYIAEQRTSVRKENKAKTTGSVLDTEDPNYIELVISKATRDNTESKSQLHSIAQAIRKKEGRNTITTLMKAAGVSSSTFKSPEGDSAFSISCRSGHFKLLPWLVKAGFDPTASTNLDGVIDVAHLLFSYHDKASVIPSEFKASLLPNNWKDAKGQDLLDHVVLLTKPEKRTYFDKKEIDLWIKKQSQWQELVSKAIKNNMIYDSSFKEYLKKPDFILGSSDVEPAIRLLFSGLVDSGRSSYYGHRGDLKVEMEEFEKFKVVLSDIEKTNPNNFKLLTSKEAFLSLFKHDLLTDNSEFSHYSGMNSYRNRTIMLALFKRQYLPELTWDEGFSELKSVIASVTGLQRIEKIITESRKTEVADEQNRAFKDLIPPESFPIMALGLLSAGKSSTADNNRQLFMVLTGEEYHKLPDNKGIFPEQLENFLSNNKDLGIKVLSQCDTGTWLNESTLPYFKNLKITFEEKVIDAIAKKPIEDNQKDRQLRI